MRDHGIDYESEREDPLDYTEPQPFDAAFTALCVICVVCVLLLWFIARQGVTP